MAYTPQQNGVSERKNRTVVEMAKSMLHEKGLPYMFWAEAVNTAVHKLEENSHKCIFVGYGASEKGYRLFDPISRKIVLSRDVIFDEGASWNWNCNEDTGITFPVSNDHQDANENCEIGENSHSEEYTVSQSENMFDRSQAHDDTPKKWRSINEIMAQCNMCVIEPENYDDAAKDESWRSAMKAELDMIEKNNTWQLVERPYNKPVIEVEYASAAEATSQAKWLRFVLEDFGEEQVEGTQIMCDNTSAIAMAKNPVFHQKTKHINRKFHFIREAIQAKEIKLVQDRGADCRYPY
ncbi:hypothetical protein D8674_017175 [Pyrus ussuriensis x Pyrus communis]|uniref:Retroviral polymerase SH3-like domain-containing protein n=1 Tax=Pyrus ussuriensis x Pyrus communis TaxID=2448454 RepID=A0A5N5HCC2_9ROSA|nr:hypothetical protein D8674_017175 [Pyrus ussuriensis x Pyrus communis]